jgi:hypothetical protein
MRNLQKYSIRTCFELNKLFNELFSPTTEMLVKRYDGLMKVESTPKR